VLRGLNRDRDNRHIEPDVHDSSGCTLQGAVSVFLLDGQEQSTPRRWAIPIEMRMQSVESVTNMVFSKQPDPYRQLRSYENIAFRCPPSTGLSRRHG